jgi:hypothetical protein
VKFDQVIVSRFYDSIFVQYRLMINNKFCKIDKWLIQLHSRIDAQICCYSYSLTLFLELPFQEAVSVTVYYYTTKKSIKTILILFLRPWRYFLNRLSVIVHYHINKKSIRTIVSTWNLCLVGCFDECLGFLDGSLIKMSALKSPTQQSFAFFRKTNKKMVSHKIQQRRFRRK